MSRKEPSPLPPKGLVRPNPPPSPPKKGFTYIEFLIILTIIVILLSIAWKAGTSKESAESPKSLYYKTPTLNTYCIDGVEYIGMGNALTVKFNKHSTINKCEELE